MKIFEVINTPKYMFHVTKTQNVPAILQNGISPRGNSGVYFWDTLEMAEWFRDFQNDNNESRTILAVDVANINLTSDPEAEDMSEWSSKFEPGTNGGAWITTDKLPPKILEVYS